MNGYELSRKWFDFCFENPEKINPNHSALFFFCIEHCNRLGWKSKFGLPTSMAMEAIGIKSYNTYTKTFNDLIDFGFVVMVQKSKNQYSSNIIALSFFDKALDKAMQKHLTKQCKSTGESKESIDKQYKQINYKNKEEEEEEEEEEEKTTSSPSPTFFPKKLLPIRECVDLALQEQHWCEIAMMQLKIADLSDLRARMDTFLSSTILNAQGQEKTLKDFKQHFVNWQRKQTIDKTHEIKRPKIEIV